MLSDMEQQGRLHPASVNVVLLGPVGVERDGSFVSPPSPLLCALLAALALAEGRNVSRDGLTEQVWGDRGPGSSRSTVAVAMHRLRRWLKEQTGDRILIHGNTHGYAIELGSGATDLARFRALAKQAAGVPAASALPMLRQALQLWRGRPLENVPAGQSSDSAVTQLERERSAVQLQYAHAALHAGQPETAIEVILPVAEEYPLDEIAHALLIEALAANGRQGEALEIFERLRARLADKLGLDPGPQLREAHLRVLRQELPMVAADRAGRQRAADIAPAQLPANAAKFTGRDEHLSQLDELVATQGSAAGVGISVIAGTAGVGKTALALHWAHRVRDRFPDGQLFVNLRGFDPGGSPMPPHAVLSRFLRAMGVDAADIPSDVEEAASLYRSRLAGHRVLVVLDNASSTSDVRSLLPGSSTCVVLITSRNRLSGLVAQQGARLIELAALSPTESHALLKNSVDRVITAEESLALDGLAKQCAHLPLALRLAAAHLTCHPHVEVADYTELLANGSRLTILDNATDDHDAISAAFQSSYVALTPEAQKLFRLLSLVPGTDVGTPAAAALLGKSFASARLPLDELCATHLAAQHVPGRYVMHDLLRAYATARAKTDEPPDALTEAARRLVDFYTETVYEAAPLLRVGRRESPRDIVYPLTEPLRFGDREEALDWHDHERDNLLGTIGLAGRQGWHTPAWQLADTLFPYFTIRRRWPEWFAAYNLGLASAEGISDQEAISHMHIGLGIVHKQTGNYTLARSHYVAALQLAEVIGHRQLISSCNINLGGLCVNEGDAATGIKHLRVALADREYLQPQVAVALYINYGCALLDIHNLVEAAEALTTALEIALQTDDLQRACYAHHNLAEVALRRAHPDDARGHAEAELQLAHRSGDPLRQAAAYDMLASTICYADRPAARQHWQEALALYQKLNHRLTESMAAWLDTIDSLDADALTAADNIRREKARKLL